MELIFLLIKKYFELFITNLQRKLYSPKLRIAQVQIDIAGKIIVELMISDICNGLLMVQIPNVAKP